MCDTIAFLVQKDLLFGPVLDRSLDFENRSTRYRYLTWLYGQYKGSTVEFGLWRGQLMPKCLASDPKRVWVWCLKCFWLLKKAARAFLIVIEAVGRSFGLLVSAATVAIWVRWLSNQGHMEDNTSFEGEKTVNCTHTGWEENPYVWDGRHTRPHCFFSLPL